MKKILITITAMLLTTTSAFAASYGISGTVLYYDASGSETTKTSGEKNNKSETGLAPVLSVFVEQELDSGVTVGLDLVPYSAEVGSASMNSDDDIETAGTNKVDVNFKNQVTLYADFPIGSFDGGYLKAGVHQVTVETDDKLSTGSKYGDEDLNGIMLGIGKRGDTSAGGFFKIEGLISIYEGGTFNAATGGNTTGDDSVFNKVELDDLITAGIKVSVGF